MSKCAFLSSFVPGNTDEKPFTDAVVKVLGRDPSIAELSVLRRLLHESYNLTVSELQVQVERTDDSAPRKLAAPDRADRLQRQQLRFEWPEHSWANAPGACGDRQVRADV